MAIGNEYYQIDAVSHSRLRNIGRSPACYRYHLDHPEEATDAQEFGQLVHTMILEPAHVDSRFVIGLDIERRSKADKQAWADFEAENIGRTIIRAKDIDLASAIARSVLSHPIAGPLVEEAVCNDRIEEAIVWQDREFRHIRRKTKIDAILPGGKIWDLKTTKDAGPSFRRSLVEYGYHTQAAYNAEGLESRGESFTGFSLIAVEKAPPHSLVVYDIDPEAIRLGRRRVRGWLSLLADCIEANRWPGYPEKRVPISLPDWYSEDTEEEHWDAL